MVNLSHRQSSPERRRQAAIMALVALLHLLMLYWFAMMRGAVPAPEMAVPAFDITLFEFAGGGGTPASDSAPAAEPARSSTPPSAIHVPKAVVWSDQLPAPLLAAPQELTVTAGTIPVATEESELLIADAPAGSIGQGGGTGGGAGDGNGPGQGSGSGPGIGRGSGLVLIRGPAGATISQNVSPQSLASMDGGYGILRCVVEVDQRLKSCRILREHPAGSGMGQAALIRSREFRFRPPYRSGRFARSHRVTVAIAFPPPVEAVETRP